MLRTRFHRAVLSIRWLIPFGLAFTANAQSPGDSTLLETEHGVVRGSMEEGLLVFRGIPYAAPPVGAMRWKPPGPPIAWEGVRDAAQFGPPCPSIDTSRFMEGRRVVVGRAEIFIDIPLVPGASEDCLHLNVWAPMDAEQAAVMVWIQPLGASSLPVFDGAAFAREGVVFVSLDYRQLILGNFAHPALTNEAEPNEPLSRYQTMDQIAALRWVERNIAAFGGDPDNVTLFGESAGAASTLQILAIPDARGLVDRAIIQSGVGWWAPMSLSQMERVGVMMATEAGLTGPDVTAEQLRALSPDALPQIGVYSVDGRLELENATTAIDEGRIADIPIMVGSTDFDGSSLRGRGAEDVVARASSDLLAAYASDGLSGEDLGYQMYTDEHVSAPARWIARKTSDGAPSYLYLFSYVLSESRGRVRGAAHGDDMWFLFDAWEYVNPRVALTDEDRAASNMLRSCWVSFAQTGEPQCDGAPNWPRYTPQGDELMELGSSAQVRQNFRKPQLDAQEASWQNSIEDVRARIEDAVSELERAGF